MPLSTTQARSPARSPASVAARILANETAKGLHTLWSHKVTLVPQVALLALMYLLFQLIFGGGRLVEELLPQTLFAFSVYVITYLALLKMVAGTLEELNTGTLEQSHLTPLPPWLLAAGRLGAVFVEGMVTAAVVAILFTLALDVDVQVEPAAVLPLLLTLADIAGFALLLAGLALVVHSIGAIVHVINSILMLLNGSVVPIWALPEGLETAAKLLPTTLGIDASRRILFEDDTLALLWLDHTLFWTALHAATMLAVGWTVYQTAIRRGLRDGRLGP